MTTDSKAQLIISQAAKCRSLETAVSIKNRSHKASGIILGDDRRYWVLPIGQAEYLAKRGYEYAEYK